MKNIERIAYIAAILLAGLFLLKKPSERIVVNTIPGDTIKTTIYIDKPIPYGTIIYNTDTLCMHDTISIKDTIYVYDDCFKMYAYNVDTTVSDVNVKVNSLITQNRLYRQDISILNNRKTAVVEEDNNGIIVGGVVGLRSVIPTISYQYNKSIFGFGYNLYDGGIVLQYGYKFNKK